jgi:transposase
MKKPASMSETKSRRKFDMAFKREALAMWANSSKSATEIASELGLDSPNILYIWRQKLTAPSSNSGSQTPAEQAAEIQELRRENERLRQQRDILKKTLGILSEPPGSGMKGSRP